MNDQERVARARPAEASTCECDNRLTFDGFELWCTACGLVVDSQAFDYREPFRADGDGTIIEGTHGPPQTPGLGSVGSMISYGARDANGRSLSADPAARTRLHRMRRVQAHGVSGRQRSRDDMARTLNEIAGRLGLPKAMRERALNLARRADSRGRPWWLVVSSTLLLAARERGSGLTPLDFAKAAVPGDEKVQKKAALRISRSFRSMNRTLGVGVKSAPEQFVGKLVTDLGMPRAVEAKARELLRLVPLRQGGSPRVAAAGAIYVAAKITGHLIGQRAVGDVASVSEVSIRKVMAILAAHPQVAKELSG